MEPRARTFFSSSGVSVRIILHSLPMIAPPRNSKATSVPFLDAALHVPTLRLPGDQRADDLCTVGIRKINVDEETIARTPLFLR